MKCTKCGVDKTLVEFPAIGISHPDVLRNPCNHFVGECLKCLLVMMDEDKKKEEEKRRCITCGAKYTPEYIKDLQSFYDTMFPKPGKRAALHPPAADAAAGGGDASQQPEGAAAAGPLVYLSKIDGTLIPLDYRADATVGQLKANLAAALKISENVVQLVFENRKISGMLRQTLASLNIAPGSKVLFYTSLHHFDANCKQNIIFELYYRCKRPKAFLDGSCVVFDRERKMRDHVDALRKHLYAFESTFMEHSGDKTNTNDPLLKYQKIIVNLSSLPAHMDRAYFALSAYRTDVLDMFSDTSVKVYFENQPDYELCSYSIADAGKSKAVVMCSLIRNEQGGWDVFPCGFLLEKLQITTGYEEMAKFIVQNYDK